MPQTSARRPTYTTTEVRALVNAARFDHYEQAWDLALSGLRRGEICGLTWSDINWDEKTLTVREARVSVDGTVVGEAPKTEAGERTCRSPATGRRPRRAKRRQAAEKLRAGIDYHDSGRGRRRDRTTRNPKLSRRNGKSLIRTAGLRRIVYTSSTHLRTIGHLQGVSTAVIAAWLGHENAAFTLKTYVDSQDPALRDPARVLNSVTGTESEGRRRTAARQGTSPSSADELSVSGCPHLAGIHLFIDSGCPRRGSEGVFVHGQTAVQHPRLRYLSLSRSKVYALMSSGRLGSVKIDGARRVRAVDLTECVESLTVTVAAGRAQDQFRRPIRRC